MIPPTVAEVRRLIRAMMGPEEHRGFRLGWSLFRRAHQAVAKRCHKASHRKKHASEHHATTTTTTITTTTTTTEQDAPRRGGSDPTDPSEAGAPTTAGHPAKEAGVLTDTQWERVRVLLPRQEPGQGRPRRDDRQVLCAILWVMDTGSSWRDLPEEEFGPNSTIHGRYRKWCKEGL